MTRKHSALLLDLDGTLLDTAPDMGGALNRLRAENGLDALPASIMRPVVSHGSARLVSLGFPTASGDEYERLRLRFLDIYALNLADHTSLFPGAETLLSEIERLGLPWGIVTNKPGWLTDPLLQALDLDRRAACVVSGDTLPERKPHPLPLLHAAHAINVPPRRCVYAGDAERDIQAGRAAGMTTVVAGYGYISTEDDPLSWGPSGVVTEPLQLLDWLDDTSARAIGART
jgi:2-phosphoglycolate phosphatase